MTKPTFQQVRKQHDLTLNMLIEDAQVDPEEVLLLDMWNIGEAGIIDALLSSLSGKVYRRDLLTVGDFTFAVRPPYARVADEAAKESQWPAEGSRTGGYIRMKAHLDIEQWMAGHCMIAFMSCRALPGCWFPYYLLRPARGEREDGLQIIC